jgi:hypothetical protein
MEMQAFTRNYDDLCTEAGFQFVFKCDVCGDGYKTKFIESKTYKKRGLFSAFGKGIGLAADAVGAYNIGNTITQGASILNERHQGMTPEWHKEYEQAFMLAQNEAMGHFHRCPSCHKYVCDADWNEDDSMCVEDAPRENVEVTKARAQRMKDEIQEKAQQASVFTGQIERRTTVCPQCGKPAGEGKFCNNCGAPLGMTVCPKCGAKSAIGTRFCGECGTKLG